MIVKKRIGLLVIIGMLVVVLSGCGTTGEQPAATDQTEQQNSGVLDRQHMVLNAPGFIGFTEKEFVQTSEENEASIANGKDYISYTYYDQGFPWDDQHSVARSVQVTFAKTDDGSGAMQSLALYFEREDTDEYQLVIPNEYDLAEIFGIKTSVAPVDEQISPNVTISTWSSPITGIDEVMIYWEDEGGSAKRINTVGISYTR